MLVIWLILFFDFALSFHIPILCASQSRGRVIAMSASNYRKERRSRPPVVTVKKAPSVSESNGLIRLNKCITSLSRRAADTAIKEGKVTVNSRVATCGMRVNFGDIVACEGKVQRWESTALAKEEQPLADSNQRKLFYVKYWKPTGVTCTSDPSDKSNIISAGGFDYFPQRLFSVGRLDKESSGLILLTSDGRVNNAMLNQRCVKEKVYLVEMERPPSDEQVAQLSAGVVITTPTQRDKSGDKRGSRTIDITAKTLPCKIRRSPRNDRVLEITLIEGRNRQIRRMAEAVGLEVVRLHRTSFAGITLKGLTQGDWLELTPGEMVVVQRALAAAESKRTQ